MVPKNGLLTLAVLSCAFDVVHAQTNVTVYGLADMGIDRQTGGATGTVTKLSSGIQSGSRLGFKGVEDLSGGASAIFLLEMGVAMDAGGSNQGGLAFGRQIYAGLKGDAGAVTLGRQYTPLAIALCGDVDPFACGLAGSSANLIANGGTAANGGSGSRINNAIKYASPAQQGFNMELLYGFGEIAGDAAKGRTVAGSIGYTNSPVTIKLAYNNIYSTTATRSAKVTYLGGKYDFGVVIVGLGMAINKDAFAGNFLLSNSDSRDYIVGVTIPSGASTFMASYIRKSDLSSARNDAAQMALGYTYALSRRTNFYTSFARITNTAANTQAASFYTVGNAIDGGTGNRSLNAGIRYHF